MKLMSVTGWPHDPLCTPDLPELLAELTLRALDLAPAVRRLIGSSVLMDWSIDYL
jgi:hypothetical protein